MRRPTRFGGALAAALLAAAFATMPVAAAGTLTVNPPSGANGQVLTAQGSGFPGGQLITLRWDGVILTETGSSADDGSFSIGFAIPASAAVGGHELRACVRSNCSLAPPFTVAVTQAPSAGPSATPASTPPPSEPAVSASAGPSSSPRAAPTGGVSPGPVDSGSPGPSGEPSPSGQPSPAASASGVIVAPSVAPTLVPAGPADPDTFGRLRQAWPWLLVAGGGLGLALLALYVVLSRNDTRALKSKSGHSLESHGSEKWLKGDFHKFGPGEATDDLAAGTAPPDAGQIPKLYEAAAKGTHAPPAPGDQTPPSVSEFSITKMVDGGDPTIAPDTSSGSGAEPQDDASKDVKLKGKKIGEN